MKALTLLIFVLLSCGFAYSQTNCDRYKDGYIPKNLNDALNFMDCKWSASDKDYRHHFYFVSSKAEQQAH